MTMPTTGTRARQLRKAVSRFEHQVEEYDPKALDDPRVVVLLPLVQLEIATAVQRSVRQERIDQLRTEWDWRLAEMLTVVQIEDERFRVIEGQHRLLAAKMRCPTGHMWCVMLPRSEAGTSGEADLGLKISTGRKGHDAYDKWNMRLVRGDPHEVQATKVLDQFGLRIGRTASAQTIAGASTVSEIVHGRRASADAGADLLYSVVSVILHAWPTHDYESRISRFDYRLMEAIAELIRRNPEVDLQRLATRLANKRAARWIADVTEPNNRKQALVVAMIQAYNRNLRQKSTLKW